MGSVRHFPAIDETRTVVEGPTTKVTILEDRAQVRRTVRFDAKAGTNRIAIADVAATLQDVSLSTAVLSGAARVADLRCRRALRVQSDEKPELIAEIDTEIEGIQKKLRYLSEDRARAEARHGVLADIVNKAAEEVPTDASWGVVDTKGWTDTFDELFERMRSLRSETFELYHRQLDEKEALANAAQRRAAAVATTRAFAANLELDVVAETDETITIAVEYVVPNALWRPMHRARLSDDATLELTSSAVVWQATGETWTDVELLFSTARSALGVEPPLLSDDLLATQRRAETVAVEARQVKIQRAQVDGGSGSSPPAPAARELPGVDDGGDIQLIAAPGRHTIPSDGRPAIVETGRFKAPCEARLVVVPELEPKAFLEAVATNGGDHPILAGPVELIRRHGFVGWTSMLFVARGEKFSLSFGPDDAVRVTRTSRDATEIDHVDAWRIRATLSTIYLSNLSGDPKRLRLTERIPVSEVEQVRVLHLDEDSSPGAVADGDGFVRWDVDLPPHGREIRRLAWSIAVAPGVEGLA